MRDTPPNTTASDLLQQMKALALPLDRAKLARHSRLAVLSGCGDTETGFHGDGPQFRPVRLADAVYVLQQEREKVIPQFLVEVEKIADGVREGFLINDGSEQFAIALIVADGGLDEPLLPLAGIAVQLNAVENAHSIVTEHDLDATWDDFDDRATPLENERSEVPDITIQAYRDAIYRVAAEPPFSLAVDQPSHDLERVYREAGVRSAAFLTACNPVGRPLRRETNEDRQRQLRADLETEGLSFVEGVGCDPVGRWAGEPSFLVLGISSDQAEALGKNYRQNAIVWASDDAVPRLVLLR